MADNIPQGPLTVPEDVDPDWTPDGYEPGPDEPGDVDTECGAETEGKVL